MEASRLAVTMVESEVRIKTGQAGNAWWTQATKKDVENGKWKECRAPVDEV